MHRLTRHPLVRKLLSPVGFVLAGLMFLLPFITASCQVGSVTVTESYTGVELGTAQPPDLDPLLEEAIGSGTGSRPPNTPPPPRSVPVEWTIVGGFGAVLVGALMVLVRRPLPRALIGTAAPGVAGILLTAGVIQARRAVNGALATDLAPMFGPQPQVDSMTIRIGYGFWVALAVLVMLLAGNVASLVRATRQPIPTTADQSRPRRRSRAHRGEYLDR